jgi:putative phosphoesterase
VAFYQAVTTVGIISDTHGLLRDEAVGALAGVDLILHAGDIGPPAIIERLSGIAPVYAVLGNVDKGGWLPAVRTIGIESVRVLLLHELSPFRGTEGVRVVVFGHSHKPLVEERGGVLFVNPGSAGPRRFKLPVTIARMRVDGAQVSAEVSKIVD